MKKYLKILTAAAAVTVLAGCTLQGGGNADLQDSGAVSRSTYTVTGNPIFPFNTSDPAVHTFRDPGPGATTYMYTTSDLPSGSDPGNKNYPMNKIFFFATTDLTHWVVCTYAIYEYQLGWVKPDSTGLYPNHLWAPDVIQAPNGKYYLYVPDVEVRGSKTIRIGVAVSNHPWGVFNSTGAYMAGLSLPSSESSTLVQPYLDGYASDPSVTYSWADGNYYLAFCTGDYPVGRIAMVKLNPLDLTQIAPGETPHLVKGLPNYYMEGPSFYSDYGKSYLIYAACPVSGRFKETIEYSTCDTPTGTYQPATTTIMDPNAYCATNQASMISWGNQWVMFYHNTFNSEKYTNRKVCAEFFTFTWGGEIPHITQTTTGIAGK